MTRNPSSGSTPDLATPDAVVLVMRSERDRLRAIEAAARAVLSFLPGPANGANPPGPFVNAAAALRSALDPTPSEGASE